MTTMVDHIEAAFRERGGEAYLGERVSMSEHMLQAAATAQQWGAADSVVVAALLHDIGHLVNDDLAEAYDNMRAIILAERHRIDNRRASGDVPRAVD